MLFVPLQYKSYKSMKQMQVIQPKVLALQEKLKDDRDRLNKELIKLYRDHKVNPVGGCLPMVLQMPVFVALFNILYMTIDHGFVGPRPLLCLAGHYGSLDGDPAKNNADDDGPHSSEDHAGPPGVYDIFIH